MPILGGSGVAPLPLLLLQLPLIVDVSQGFHKSRALAEPQLPPNEGPGGDRHLMQVLPAVVGLVGVVVGVLVGAWRQSLLQQGNWLRDDLRRWQQDRRRSYLKLVQADDELYRCVIRDLRDPPPGQTVTNSGMMDLNEAIPPLTKHERIELLRTFDRLWRAKREIELLHLTDDALLVATNKLTLKDAELVSLMLFDLTNHPENAQKTTIQIRGALKVRRDLIDQFMQEARTALNVPRNRST
ncbi:hypothetical protein HII36_02510 [Nonomuraea sp. NN258]|uniref:hypothetical protein n=1 Tax=Nonomuraea antri TaxID=2730852 RepID=UPI001569C2C2|nr:hypothetical protein [Nonomuraea antri]NRQ30710.1 hypothetical protein [Nonomuraea antri]